MTLLLQRTIHTLASTAAIAAALGCSESRPTEPQPEPPATTRTGPDSTFVWGINGHPVTQRAYHAPVSLGEQATAIQQLGASYYRVDVSQDAAGNVLRGEGGQTFDEVLAATEAHHLHILPVLASHPAMPACRADAPTVCASTGDNNALGYARGLAFARKYGKRVTHVEAGNELDNESIYYNWPGDVLAHYDPARLTAVTTYMRGMIRGIRQGAPGMKIIASTGGWYHVGFLEALVRDDVKYDLIGYHWYSEMGSFTEPREALGGLSVYDRLLAFGKDIWVTESGRRYGSSPLQWVDGSTGERRYAPATADSQAVWIDRYVDEMYPLGRVKAFFVYELLSQTGSDEAEGEYGVFGKPAFQAYKRAIAARRATQ